MTVLAVAFDGVRLNDSTANTGWNNWPAGGQAPSSEANNFYVNGSVVNAKLSSTSLDGIQYAHGSLTDMTSATRRLFFGKTYTTDYGALDSTYGASLQTGSADTAHYKYNVAGSGAKISRFKTYPSTGGYLIAAINPNVSGWRDSTTGAPALASVDWFGAQSDWIASASAKSENFCFDAIDVGTGLTITLGTGADPQGTFPDFVVADQNTVANRWGVCFGAGPLVQAQGRLTIGSATATEFNDQTSVLLFLDSYVDAGDNGVTVNLSSASTTVDIGCSISGLGAKHTEADTRPDHIVTGTAGVYNLTGSLANHRNVALTSATTADGALIACSDLEMAGAEVRNGTLLLNSVSTVASCDDAIFSDTDFHDMSIVQAGAGHAFSITGSETFTNCTWAGFGANDSNDAAILVNTTSPVTLTISGGDTPTYRTIGSSNVTISNPKIATMTFQFVGGNPANFEWRLYEDSGVAGELGTVALEGAESETNFGSKAHNYTYTGDQDVVLQVMATGFEEAQLYFTLGNADQTRNILIQPEENL